MTKVENRKILITGGAGFIGSNLCENLLRNGNEVVCLDNFSTGKRKNIEPFLDYQNFSLIEGDIRNLDDCQRACSNMEFVLHQAALGSVPRSISDPITTNSVNISAATGSTTFNGFLRAIMIPLMFGILGSSAIPF